MNGVPLQLRILVEFLTYTMAALGIRELWSWFRQPVSSDRRRRAVRAMFFAAAVFSLLYAFPRAARLALRDVCLWSDLDYDTRRHSFEFPNLRSEWEFLESRVPEGATILMVMPTQYAMRDIIYYERKMSYLLYPRLLDYGRPAGGRMTRVSHDFRKPDQGTPGYLDPTQYFRPLDRPPADVYDFLFVARTEPWRPDGGFVEADRSLEGILYRRTRP